MANNNSYDKFKAVKKQRLNDFDVNLECSINLETTEQVNKILAVNSIATIGNIEELTGEATVNGSVQVSLVYLTEQGLVCNASYTSPFITKVIDTKINPNSKVFCKVAQADSKVQSVNNNVAKVDCYLNLKAYVINSEEVTYLNGVAENVCTLTEQTDYCMLKGVTNSVWTESLETEVKEEVKQVISCFSEAIVKQVEPQDNCIELTCEIVNTVMYLTSENEIKTVYFKNDAKQDIECEFCDKKSLVEIDLKVDQNNVKNSINNAEGGIKISIDVPLTVCAKVYCNNNINLIADLYSTQDITNSTMVSYENSIVCEPIVFEKKIEGSLSLSADEPRIDKLLSVNYSKAIVTNEYLENGEYTVSGVVSSNLIYYNQDDAVVNSIDVEFPFVIGTKTDLEGELLTDFDVLVEDVDVMVKKGKDVYIDAAIKVRTTVCKTTRGVVMSDVEYSEPLPLKDCAIEIYFAKAGEKVWDIAKKLFVTPETIYMQNPNIQEILENDEKLAIYYKLNLENNIWYIFDINSY